jgi:hypothetical protein
MTSRGRGGGLALVVAALSLVGALAPGSPVAAAPPAVTHPGLVNPNPIDVTPHVLDVGPCKDEVKERSNCRTEAVLDLGTRVVVGGNFIQVKRYSQPTVFDRPYLFAYDKATGTIDTTFRPRPNGKVTALLRASDGGVLVSGQFSSIGGRSIPYVAKIDPVTGAASSTFAPRPDGMVYDMHQAGGHLYLGGTFTKVGGTARTNFAAVDPATGAVRTVGSAAFGSAPNGTTSRVMRFDVSPDGKKLVAIGNFARVGGQIRENVAVLDLTPAGGSTAAAWRTDRYKNLTCGNINSSWDTVTYDVDMAPTGSWFVVVTTGGPGGTAKLCDSATRWETVDDGTATPTWVNWTGGDSLTSVAVTGAAVYVAGHNRWLDNPQGSDDAGPGALVRTGIGALSPSTGRALSWNPGRERGLVATRLVATAEGLYVLSDSDKFAGEFHPRLTYLTLTGTQPPPGPKPSAPGTPAVTAATATTAAVSWGAASSSTPVTGYTIVARTGTTTLSTKDVGTARSTTFSGLPTGKAVTFSVTARSAAGTGPAATSAPAVLPFATVDAFTEQQFRDLVGRAPTGAELADWRTRVGGATATPQAAVDQLLSSASVGKVASVVRLYEAYYERLPDAAGFRYWRDQVRRGVSVDAVSQSFATAAEFRTRYGALNDGQFVDRVYLNVLGRPADASGKSYWVGRLRAGVSRGKVMTGFSESPENKTATKRTTDIVLVIHLLLDRRPSTNDLGWGGSRAEQVRIALTSAEYDRRV